MRLGSLFSGIGGLELGLERAGFRTLWQVEKDPWCRALLAERFPYAARHEDVHDVGSHNLEEVDLICGGFPCQPVSVAGKRRAQEDERWLWPEFARILRELRPKYALLENVPGLLFRGFGDVLGSLAELGYDAEWDVFGAWEVGAPHRRDRVFVFCWDADRVDEGSLPGVPDGAGSESGGGRGGGDASDAPSERRDLRGGLRKASERRRRRRSRDASRAREEGPELRGALADADGGRRPDDELRPGGDEPRVRGEELPDAEGLRRRPGRTRRSTRGAPGVSEVDEDLLADARRLRRERVHDESRVSRASAREAHAPERGRSFRRGADGVRILWEAEPDVGRVADGVPDRVDRIRALGNAVVPQVAEWLGLLIVEREEALR